MKTKLTTLLLVASTVLEFAQKKKKWNCLY